MYRVTSFDDLESTGFFDFINTGVILIEWAENIEHELNNLKNIIKINIQKKVGQNFENTRIIEIQGVDNL